MKIPDILINKMGNKLIEPFDEKLVNPASYDITLSDYGIFKGQQVKLPYELNPGDFILVSSREYWRFPCDVAGQLLLKSTLGRHGINHMLAGWFDPDFSGHATMELKNEGDEPFMLIPGMRVAQMVFDHVFPPSHTPYRINGRYHGQRGTTSPRQQGRSATLDNTAMWVAGPYDERHIPVYRNWVKHIDKLLKSDPSFGVLESPFKD